MTEAREALYTSANWEEYKSNTLTDTVKSLTRAGLT